MYLLDTNVVSELRRPRPHGAVLAWLQSVDDAQLFLSAVTLGEIQAGIELTREQDATKASEIEARFSAAGPQESVVQVEHRYFERLDGGQAINGAINGGGGWKLLLDGFATTVATPATEAGR